MKTQYGFTYGPAEVQRICQDSKLGCWISVEGARESVEIRVTPGGRIRIYEVTKKSTTPAGAVGQP